MCWGNTLYFCLPSRLVLDYNLSTPSQSMLSFLFHPSLFSKTSLQCTDLISLLIPMYQYSLSLIASRGSHLMGFIACSKFFLWVLKKFCMELHTCIRNLRSPESDTTADFLGHECCVPLYWNAKCEKSYTQTRSSRSVMPAQCWLGPESITHYIVELHALSTLVMQRVA